LHLAIEGLHVDLVKQLLRAGAHPEARDSNGRNSIEVVEEALRNSSSIKDAEEREREIRLVLQRAVAGQKPQELEPRSVASLAKTAVQRRYIKDALCQNANLAPLLTDFNEEELAGIVEHAFLEEYPAGTKLIRQGDTRADSLYVVETNQHK